MAKLRRRETIEETVRHLESQFDELTSEHAPGELMLPLRQRVAELLRVGYAREVVLGSLDDYRYVLRDTGREEYEDDVQDVMDCMTGFSSSHMRL
jgi:hypothetical protein